MGRWTRPRKVATALLVAAVAGAAIVGLEDVGERGHLLVGSPGHTLPGAYVAVPGPWHWRWVRVARYRTVRYVPAAP
jgi:hypothetical protein